MIGIIPGYNIHQKMLISQVSSSQVTISSNETKNTLIPIIWHVKFVLRNPSGPTISFHEKSTSHKLHPKR
jgi:hypothetical protein